MSKQNMQIVLVRHGETAWNREVRFRGRADPALNDVGLQQAEAAARFVVDRWPVQAVYTSPMKRARQTARAIAEAHELTAQAFEGLLDIDFGDWQGQSPSDVKERYPDLLRAWYEAPHTVQVPGGESLRDVRERVEAGLDTILELHTGHRVAMVGHNVVNRVLLCAVIGLGNQYFWRLRQDTCGVTVFEIDGPGTGTIVVLNDTCHLRNLSP
ncbi:MAG: histidine phosphatase family protein [Anaerolineae bacterium]